MARQWLAPLDLLIIVVVVCRAPGPCLLAHYRRADCMHAAMRAGAQSPSGPEERRRTCAQVMALLRDGWTGRRFSPLHRKQGVAAVVRSPCQGRPLVPLVPGSPRGALVRRGSEWLRDFKAPVAEVLPPVSRTLCNLRDLKATAHTCLAYRTITYGYDSRLRGGPPVCARGGRECSGVGDAAGSTTKYTQSPFSEPGVLRCTACPATASLACPASTRLNQSMGPRPPVTAGCCSSS